VNSDEPLSISYQNSWATIHEPLALRIAMRWRYKLPPGVSLDDVSQECLLAAWELRDRHNPALGTEEGFFWVVMKSAARWFVAREWRRGLAGDKPRVRFAGESELEFYGSGLGNLPATAKERTVWPMERWRTVQRHLSPRQYSVVTLKTCDGLSDSEIEAKLGMSRGAADRLWTSAVTVLRSQWSMLAVGEGDSLVERVAV
jgi:RNA polymerase sigma factor (sigma-70 family)